MSVDEAADDGSMQVVDEEGAVDRKRKEWILNLRRQVAEIQSKAIAERAFQSQDAASVFQVANHMVQQYLLAIEPLLADPKIPQSDHYYTQVELGKVEIAPPEEWRRDNSRPTHEELARSGSGPGFDFIRSDPPTPEEIPIKGIKTVIENDSVESNWNLTVVEDGRPRDIHINESRPIPPKVFFNAVRKSDIFLQQAGVGLDIGHEEKDEREDEPF